MKDWERESHFHWSSFTLSRYLSLSKEVPWQQVPARHPWDRGRVGEREESRGRKVRLSRWRGRENRWQRREGRVMSRDTWGWSFPLLLPVFFFVFWGGFQWPVSHWRALSSPLENQYIHPNASISSPSGAGYKDLLCDWARAKAQQGGVKPAGMFHIHTQREYIISPSGHCAVRRKRLTLMDNSYMILTFGKLFHRLLLREVWSDSTDRCCIQSDQAIWAHRFAGQIMTYGWAQHALWPSPLIPLRPAHTTGCGAEICWGGGCALHGTGLLALPWSNKPRIKMSRG